MWTSEAVGGDSSRLGKIVARRNVQYVIVCEDRQHEVFVRRFLKKMGVIKNNRSLRIEKAPVGRGAADKFVLDRYVTELKAARQAHVDRKWIILLDGDKFGVASRLRQLKHACEQKGVQARSAADRVAVFIPTWNIETWLAYLGGEDVDEERRDYPKLAQESDCKEHVAELAAMCRNGQLRQPAPASLRAACREYENQLR